MARRCRFRAVVRLCTAVVVTGAKERPGSFPRGRVACAHTEFEENASDRVSEVDENHPGRFLRLRVPLKGPFRRPASDGARKEVVTCGPDGLLNISDAGCRRARSFDTVGTFVRELGQHRGGANGLKLSHGFTYDVRCARRGGAESTRRASVSFAPKCSRRTSSSAAPGSTTRGMSRGPRRTAVPGSRRIPGKGARGAPLSRQSRRLRAPACKRGDLYVQHRRARFVKPRSTPPEPRHTDATSPYELKYASFQWHAAEAR